MKTLRHPGGAPKLADAAGILGVLESDLDSEFGVVEIDPARDLYAVVLEESAAASSEGGDGPYSNPLIAAFGRRTKG